MAEAFATTGDGQQVGALAHEAALRADRMFRELKERETLEDDLWARLTRQQFFTD